MTIDRGTLGAVQAPDRGASREAGDSRGTIKKYINVCNMSLSHHFLTQISVLYTKSSVKDCVCNMAATVFAQLSVRLNCPCDIHRNDMQPKLCNP